MNVARLSFSHGTQAQHLEVITTGRRIAERLGRPVAILQDLEGTVEQGARIVATTRRWRVRPPTAPSAERGDRPRRRWRDWISGGQQERRNDERRVRDRRGIA
jgi:pyruvate kinase-like protein